MYSHSTWSLCFTVGEGCYAFTLHRVPVFLQAEGCYAFTLHRVPVFYSEGGNMHSHSTYSLFFTVGGLVCIHIPQSPCVLL